MTWRSLATSGVGINDLLVSVTRAGGLHLQLVARGKRSEANPCTAKRKYKSLQNDGPPEGSGANLEMQLDRVFFRDRGR